MKINRIYGRNFMSYESFDLPITPGKHLIRGVNNSSESSESNGSGKSSLLESISWTLFKKSTRTTNPSRNKLGSCMTGVEMEISGNKYRIERFFGDPILGNNIQIYENDQNISNRKPSLTEQDLGKIIGVDYDIFISTILVAQGMPKNFSGFTPTLKKSMLENLIGLVRWVEYRKRISNKSSEFRKSYNTLTSLLESIKNNLIKTNSRIETLKEVKSRMEETLVKDISDAEDELSRYQKKIREVGFDVKDKVEYDNLVSSIKQMRNSAGYITSQINDLKQVVNLKVCPTCNRDYPEDRINDATEKSLFLKQKISRIFDTIKSLEVKEKEIADKLELYRRLEIEHSRVIKRVHDLKSQKIDSKEIEDLEETCRVESERYNETNLDSEDIKTKVQNFDYIDSLLLPSSKFRLQVISKYLDYINSIVDSICQMVFSDIGVSLVESGDGIDFKIVRGNNILLYGELSGGERRRVDVVIILALQKFLIESSGISINVLAMDEIFDGLDGKGIQVVLDAIDVLFCESESVYVITHVQGLKSIFDNVITVVKENDISKIESIGESGCE